MSDERTYSIPELRGFDGTRDAEERESNREQPYSAASYTAQYGLAIQDVEDILERCFTHEQVVREIESDLMNDPELFQAAIKGEEIAVYKARSMKDE
jgi:hypothetical protein